MASGKMTWVQRQELHGILNHLNEPSYSPEEHMLKFCVLCFLNGKDAEALLAKKVPDFVAKRMADKARVWIGNERAKRRMRSKEILASRLAPVKPEFTSENFRVTMDYSQHRNYGMVNVSIYCLVEVWVGDDEMEKEYLVNFSDFKTKEWLTRLLVWGLMNQREILLKPAGDHEMKNMRMFSPKDRDSRLEIAG